MKKLIVFATFAGLLLVAPRQGEAQTPAGMFKVHLDSGLFGFAIGEEDPERGGDREYDQASVGLGVPWAGVGVGYTVIDRLVIGGRVTIGLEGMDEYHFDAGGFTWSVMPYLEYIFLEGIFRPFVMGTLGFEGFGIDDDVYGVDFDKHWWSFTFGGGGGAHFFIYDRISFVATLLFTFGVGTGEYDIAGPDDDFSHWRFCFATLAGLSVWL